MKTNHITRVAMAGTVCALAALHVSAQSFQFKWEGDVFPQDNTPALPVNANVGSPIVTSNGNGTFTINTTNRTYARSYRNATEWTGWDVDKFTIVEFRARVDRQDPQNSGDQALPILQRYAQTIRFFNDAGSGSELHYSFFLRNGTVGFGRDLIGDLSTDYSMDTTNDFHVYRIVLFYDKAELYVDGSLTPALTAFPTNSFATGPRIEFGDLSGTYGSGQVTYDYIRWANNIPEAGVASLIGVSAALVCFLRSRRRES